MLSLNTTRSSNLRASSQRPRLAAVPVPRRSAVVVLAHGHGATKVMPTGFIAEMRQVAMKLHTKEQAPKEGERAAPKVQMVWTPTVKGYLAFLNESKAVYETFEQIMADAKTPEYARFKNTGLERAAALAKDVQWFKTQYGVDAPALDPEGPGQVYCRLISKLAESDPPAFICHYYNFYFAHTAGGRMIGKKVASMILDSQELAFYQWEGDVAEHLDRVRAQINELADSWSREQKDHCLQETEASFQYSGKLMQCITQQ